jgi:hypothetical protein
MPAIIAAQASDPLAVDISAKLVDRQIIDGTYGAKAENQKKVVVEVLTCEGRIYVPAADSLCGKVISQFHDNPESGHFRALQTTEL